VVLEHQQITTHLNYEHEVRQTMIKLLRTAAFLLCTAVAVPVMAQNVDKGRAAALAGDYATALQELRPLAEQGNAPAQRGIGVMYNNGEGVLQDYAEAVNWFRLAAEQGDALAQYNLGIMYHNGEGVLQDDAEAVNWYRLAAEQGDAAAQNNLGLMYSNGEGVVQDAVLAHMWYNISGAIGAALGSENRGKIEQQMTREQVADAQVRARSCMSSDYQDCD
jgi:TPR repeat protein